MKRFFSLLFLGALALSIKLSVSQENVILRVATFNVSIEASNYSDSSSLDPDIVKQLLATKDHPQLQNIAEIVQRVRPDVLLLNEFDYIENPEQGIAAFIKNYLNHSQNGAFAIDYPYWYIAEVNTGKASPYDLDNDGKITGTAGDAWGFGHYPGHYAMALLSRYPIDQNGVRTLQNFHWQDMPNALVPVIPNGQNWYSDNEWLVMPLSSKSHWDIPITTPNGSLHIIAAHPTPPTFDGEEDRNGKRNHDEIRLINDYLSNKNYLYDDQGQLGGLNPKSRFVILGDLNSSPNEGDSIKAAIQTLLANPLVNSDCKPSSLGGLLNKKPNPLAQYHTAAWGLRVDYVLPSHHGININDCGIYWPEPSSPQARLVSNRTASSDHRLVWADLELTAD